MYTYISFVELSILYPSLIPSSSLSLSTHTTYHVELLLDVSILAASTGQLISVYSDTDRLLGVTVVEDGLLEATHVCNDNIVISQRNYSSTEYGYHELYLR